MSAQDLVAPVVDDKAWLDTSAGIEDGLWAELDCPPITFTRRRSNESMGFDVIDFCETFFKTAKGNHWKRTGEPFEFMDWQKESILGIFEVIPGTEKLRFNQANVWANKRNGKTEFCGNTAAWAFLSYPENSNIYIFATSKPQADHIFRTALRAIKSAPDFNGIYTAHDTETTKTIKNEVTGTKLMAMAHNVKTIDGFTPDLILCDEMHRWENGDLWELIEQSLGTQPNVMVINISTAGDGNDKKHVSYQQWEASLEAVSSDEPEMFVRAWNAPLEAAFDTPEEWARANPAYGVTIDADDFRRASKKNKKAFRRYRGGMWMAGESSWHIAPMLRAAKNPLLTPLQPRDLVFGGFDGAYREDSSALIGFRPSDKSLHVLEEWVRPEDAPDDWIVDSEDVMDAMRLWASVLRFEAIGCDPAFWKYELVRLANEGLPIVGIPQSEGRQIPAVKAFERLVEKGEIQHNDARLSDEFDNVMLKESRRWGGHTISKLNRSSKRKIDKPIACVMAVDLWQEWTGVPEESYAVEMWG